MTRNYWSIPHFTNPRVLVLLRQRRDELLVQRYVALQPISIKHQFRRVDAVVRLKEEQLSVLCCPQRLVCRGQTLLCEAPLLTGLALARDEVEVIQTIQEAFGHLQ